jgi:phosphopantetheinyl transferase
MIHRLQLAGAPHGLEIAVMEGGDGARRGLAALELDHLFETLLPGHAIVRLSGGRPVVRGRGDLHVSLSHAQGTSVLAAAPFPVGIDIEPVDPDLDALAIDPALFGARDFAFLQAQAGAARRAHFYRLWTLKEARLKRFGRTLASDPLPELLTGDADPGSAALEGRLGTDMSTGWLTRAGQRYCVGVCWGTA